MKKQYFTNNLSPGLSPKERGETPHEAGCLKSLAFGEGFRVRL